MDKVSSAVGTKTFEAPRASKRFGVGVLLAITVPMFLVWNATLERNLSWALILVLVWLGIGLKVASLCTKVTLSPRQLEVTYFGLYRKTIQLSNILSTRLWGSDSKFVLVESRGARPCIFYAGEFENGQELAEPLIAIGQSAEPQFDEPGKLGNGLQVSAGHSWYVWPLLALFAGFVVSAFIWFQSIEVPFPAHQPGLRLIGWLGAAVYIGLGITMLVKESRRDSLYADRFERRWPLGIKRTTRFADVEMVEVQPPNLKFGGVPAAPKARLMTRRGTVVIHPAPARFQAFLAMLQSCVPQDKISINRLRLTRFDPTIRAEEVQSLLSQEVTFYSFPSESRLLKSIQVFLVLELYPACLLLAILVLRSSRFAPVLDTVGLVFVDLLVAVLGGIICVEVVSRKVVVSPTGIFASKWFWKRELRWEECKSIELRESLRGPSRVTVQTDSGRLVLSGFLYRQLLGDLVAAHAHAHGISVTRHRPLGNPAQPLSVPGA